jgi:predicted nucleic-acid-binding protein
MIGLDSNVLIRYIVQDDPGQSEMVNDYIDKNISVIKSAYINQIILCEIVWVLKRAYGYNKDIIITVISKILQTKEFVVENSELVLQAVKEYQKGPADFSDYLIAARNRDADCKYTITLDKAAAKSKYFKLLTR